MRCFLLAVAQSSTLDRYTNNFSLFHLLEQFRPAGYPARLAVFSHAFFEVEAAEFGVEHEVRLVVLRDRDVTLATEPVKMKPNGERHRVRIAGLAFSEPGLYRVSVEWRRAMEGAPWIRDAASWPIRAETALQ